MKINIYYGGRGIVGDPTSFVIEKMHEIFEELNVRVERFNLYERRKDIASLPNTLNDADAIILASTVEWFGFGGYMQQFLDSCWQYGNKEKIAEIYMCPVVMATTYGEKEAMLNLINAWEILGGKSLSGLSGYVEDTTSFELNAQYSSVVEKKAEEFYRAVTRKAITLPNSNKTVLKTAVKASNIALTPQESEQLSKYASDEEYIKTTKEDIKELTSHFKNMMGSDNVTEDYYIKEFRGHFVPQKNFEASYKFLLDKGDSLVIRIKNADLEIDYSDIEEPTVLCKMSQEILSEIVSNRMTFQRAFMSGAMQVKGDFKILRMLDQIFKFDGGVA